MSEKAEAKASAFRVELRTAPQVNPAGATVILFDTVIFDRLNEFNLVTGRFTPIRAGWYLLTFNVSLESLIVGTNDVVARITQIGGFDQAEEMIHATLNDVERRNMSTLTYLTPNNQVHAMEGHAAFGNVRIRNDTAYCMFSGIRLI